MVLGIETDGFRTKTVQAHSLS